MNGFSFSQFMIEGGPGMWPVLIFGAVTVGAAGRFAARPTLRWLGFAGAMWLTVLTAMLHATLIDVSSVFHALESRDRIPDDQLVRALFMGLKESLRPGALGGLFLTLGALGVAIGAFRARDARA
jgi:hypothetical protein